MTYTLIAAGNKDFSTGWTFGLLGLSAGGKQIVPMKYSFLHGPFIDSLFIAKHGDKWGLIDTQNRVVIPFMYDSLYGEDMDGMTSAYPPDFFYFRQHDKSGVVGINTQLLYPPLYDELKWPWFDSSDLFPVRRGKKWGYADRKGNLRIAPAYDIAWYFDENGRAEVFLRDEPHLINKEGHILPEVHEIYTGSDSSKSTLLLREIYGGKLDCRMITGHVPQDFSNGYGSLRSKKWMTEDTLEWDYRYFSSMKTVPGKVKMRFVTDKTDSVYVELRKGAQSRIMPVKKIGNTRILRTRSCVICAFPELTGELFGPLNKLMKDTSLVRFRKHKESGLWYEGWNAAHYRYSSTWTLTYYSDSLVSFSNVEEEDGWQTQPDINTTYETFALTAKGWKKLRPQNMLNPGYKKILQTWINRNLKIDADEEGCSWQLAGIGLTAEGLLVDAGFSCYGQRDYRTSVIPFAELSEVINNNGQLGRVAVRAIH
jgi:hypothetical protein